MINFFKIFCGVLFALLYISCGNDYLVTENKAPLTQYAFISSDEFSNDGKPIYTKLESLYVEMHQSVRFYAGYSNGENVFTDGTLEEYYGGLDWQIGKDHFNLSHFRYTFNEPGEINGYLKTADTFGDSLKSDFKIFVNTPQKIDLTFPYNGYNQTDPTNENAMPLRWNVSGIDSWERATCQIFLSSNKDSLWESPIGSVACNLEVSLKGELVKNLNLAVDSSFTFYWAVCLKTESNSGKIYNDTSEIFQFSTKIYSKNSILKIPYILKNYKDRAINKTKVTLVNAFGDTLNTGILQKDSGTFTFKIKPQSNLKIYIQELSRKEYAPESLIVNVTQNSVIALDTLKLEDKTPPQIAPGLNSFASTDSLFFFVYDDGSGINFSKLEVLLNGDTLNYQYQMPTLNFKVNCLHKCNLQIISEDFAKNKFDKYIWEIENQNNIYKITGPFLKEDL